MPRLPFAPSSAVEAAIAPHLQTAALAALGERARASSRGVIRCFGRWNADFGDPVDWQLNPRRGERWNPAIHWTEVLADTRRVGDVKLTWELGRFPHAYDLARAAALAGFPRAEAARVVAAQISDFLRLNPYGRGVHWASGQELALRLAAWLFAISVLSEEPPLREVLPAVAVHLHEAAVHLERHLDYARKATNNNHLVSEAFGLYLAGALLPSAARSSRWAELGMDLLVEQAARQIHPDGGYLMHSHNYQRAALHVYLLALALRRKEGKAVPDSWTGAMARSVDFLAAHQNPSDGRLPNFGSNDGALVAVLTTCDYSDFRPLLQALSLASRGERLYEAGPWDEEAAWLLGPAALDAPLREITRRSRSFSYSGFHVLAGREPGTFASFRCGTLRARFTQIDMLHLDLFWRGQNVLVDGGTWLYGGPSEWLRHFTGGASHNTVTVDGRDQMLHHRQFKLLYLTPAHVLAFREAGTYALVEGEHRGFRRHPGRCVHRRAVLRVDDDLWVVADRISGAGRHSARLHWLAGSYPHRYDAAAGRLDLDTPAGVFSVTVVDRDARPLVGDVVAGGEAPPRGWSARYYGEKVPAPSLAVACIGTAPLELVSVLGAAVPRVTADRGCWLVEGEASTARFTLREGRFEQVAVEPRGSAQSSALFS